VRLHRLVDRAHGHLGGGVLGHVGRLPGSAVVAAVVDRRRLLQHQLGHLQLDLDLCQRVSDALMGADRNVPHLPLPGIGGGLVESEASVADAAGGSHDPLRVEPGEQLPQGGVGILAEEGVGR
jgi:hypothetical protein